MVYEIFLENPIYLVVIALLGAMIFLTKINEKYFASLKFRYALRLLRVVVYSLAGGVALNFFFPEHPLYLRVAIAFLTYFLLGTFIFWIFVCIETSDSSSSELFFKFKNSVVSWSVQKEHIEIKKKLELLGFKQGGSFESDKSRDFESNTEEDVIYLFSFDSSDMLTRIFVSFFPIGDVLYMVSSVESISENGTKYITETGYMYTGLSNPPNYDVKRIALESNPLKLLKIHQSRIAKKSIKLKKIGLDTLSSINQSVNEVISANIESGIVNPQQEWSENGLLSDTGKYRVWLAMIRSSYFPF